MRLFSLSTTGRTYHSSQYIPAKDVEAVSVSAFLEPPTFEIAFVTKIKAFEQVSVSVGYGDIFSALIRAIPELAELSRKERRDLVVDFLKKYGSQVANEIAAKITTIFTSDVYQFSTNPEEYFGSVEIIEISEVIVNAIIDTAIKVASKLAKKPKR